MAIKSGMAKADQKPKRPFLWRSDVDAVWIRNVKGDDVCVRTGGSITDIGTVVSNGDPNDEAVWSRRVRDDECVQLSNSGS